MASSGSTPSSASRVLQLDEVPELGHGHAGQLGLVADPRGQRRVCGQPDEGRQLAVGQDAEQVDDGRAVRRVVQIRARLGPRVVHAAHCNGYT